MCADVRLCAFVCGGVRWCAVAVRSCGKRNRTQPERARNLLGARPEGAQNAPAVVCGGVCGGVAPNVPGGGPRVPKIQKCIHGAYKVCAHHARTCDELATLFYRKSCLP